MLLDSYLQLFEQPSDHIVVRRAQLLVVGEVEPGVGVAPGAEVLVDALGLALQDAHAAPVEPVGAALAADVEPGDEEGVE